MSDPARAGFHIQPSRGWVNDPNGMVFRDGRWHVFLQHNPTAALHTNIHWAHVSSDDLVTWREHPLAFGPVPGQPDQGGSWSGVCVDLGDRVAAVYTGIVTDPVDSTVCIRYASDVDLDDWSDPVVVATVPPGQAIREMRDPFLFRWNDRRWAILGAGLTDGSPAVLLFSCDDLEAWRFERVWLTLADPVLAVGAGAEIWECPQLVEVDGSWSLLLSLWRDNQLEGAVAAVGSMSSASDGSPVLTLRSIAPVDEGRSLYAPQVAVDPDGPWFLGWVMQVGSPDRDLAGCLTLVRRLRVEGNRLLSRVDERQERVLGAVVSVEGDGTLPAHGQLVAVGDAATLRGRQLSVTVPPGGEAWFDGEVLEVYPTDAPPRTYRDPSTAAWRLSGGADAVVRHVVTS